MHCKAAIVSVPPSVRTLVHMLHQRNYNLHLSIVFLNFISYLFSPNTEMVIFNIPRFHYYFVLDSFQFFMLVFFIVTIFVQSVPCKYFVITRHLCYDHLPFVSLSLFLLLCFQLNCTFHYSEIGFYISPEIYG
jgi:hypothetical protein